MSEDQERIRKWRWIMDYCKNRGMSPTLGWKIAECEYNKAKERRPTDTQEKGDE
jgi:hypothetical protein